MRPAAAGVRMKTSVRPSDDDEATFVSETLRGINHTEALYRSIFKQLAVGVAHSDSEGRFLDVNPKFCEITGYTRKEALSLGISELTHPDDIEQSFDARTRLLGGIGSGYEREARVIRKDGSALWAHITTSLVRSADGKPAHFTSLLHDVSKQKHAEDKRREAELRLRQLAENVREVFFLVDAASAKTLYVSAAYELIWGQPVRSLYDDPQAWTRAVYPGDWPRVQAALAQARKSGHMNCDYRITRPDQTVGWINGRTFPIRDEQGNIYRLAGIAEDITQRKRAEAELNQYGARLERAMYGTIDVIAAIGAMRDPYTLGHEDRVGEIGAAIATEMGVDANRVEGVRIAGYLHDVGKMGVPQEILARSRRLTQEEFDLVKTHAQASYDILKSVEFPWPVAEIARQHHERFDGSGYPRGLKGEQILPEANIVGIADSVEAMASDRPYRGGLGLVAALSEIEKNRGKLYEPAATDACLRLFREKGYQLPARKPR
jgi:PAS domain S-box-containing protein/putative nucleotidyltransferase with HDIG domain